MEHLSFNQSPYDLSISDRQELSPSVFRAIQRSHDLCHFDRPLLQNLTSFTFKPDFGGISLRDACIFLGPRLKMLDFTIPRSLVGLRTFAKALKARCPAIEYLRISSCQSSDRVNRVVSDLVCSLSSLRTVRCGDITCHSQALECLSSCPSLQDLVVHLPDELAQQRLLDVSSKILPFLAIRSLDITVASTASVVEFFQVTSGSSDLESLSITIDSILPTAAQLHAALTVMQQSGICDTLTTFLLGDRVMSAEDSIPLHVLDAQTLLPLLQCRNLEDINIHISYGHAAIDNSLLKEMALAWPCLRYLFLFSCHYGHLWHAKADLRGLICLAQNCHSLESVGLQFDVSLPPGPTAIYPDKAIRCEWLTKLDVARSQVTNPLAVATFLTDVFPNLTIIDHEYYIRSTPPGTSIRSDFEDELDEEERSPEYIEMAKRWKDVVQILNARRQELSQSPTNCNVRMQPLICN
jgi:hypothetical protein